MKLKSVEYSNSDSWYSNEYLPDNPRSVLIYTPEGGTAEGKYESKEAKWIQYRWNCTVVPKYWREMPRYNGGNGSLQ
jgi:hypothetical protein